MTDLSVFRKIGYKQAFKAITIGLLIAYFIMALMAGPLWLFQIDFAPRILFACATTYIAGYFFGGLIGAWIFKDNRHAIFFGIVGGFLIVWIGTFFGSLIGFLKEGLPNKSEINDPTNDYIFKPIGLVTMFGFIPIIVIGIWFGLSVKKKINKVLKMDANSFL